VPVARWAALVNASPHVHARDAWPPVRVLSVLCARVSVCLLLTVLVETVLVTVGRGPQFTASRGEDPDRGGRGNKLQGLMPAASLSRERAGPLRGIMWGKYWPALALVRIGSEPREDVVKRKDTRGKCRNSRGAAIKSC
jgi:hypothetical protein